MTKRWLDDGSGARDFEREVLSSGLGEPPPAGASDALWQRLLVVLPVPPVGGGGGPLPRPVAPTGHVGLSKATVALAVAKGFGAGVLVTGALLVAQGRVHPSPAKPAVSANIAPPRPMVVMPTPPMTAALPQAEAVGPKAVDATLRAAESARGAGEPSSRVDSPGSVAEAPAPTDSVARFPDGAGSSADALAAEARLLRSAHERMRAGNLTGAAADLRLLAVQIPNARLRQEREALGIELLYRSGQTAEASARAREFLGRYPQSPLASQVRQWLGPGG